MKGFVATLGFLVFFWGSIGFSSDLDWVELEKKLQTTGLKGWIHGSVPQSDLFVFTYRSPDNFFNAIQFSLLPSKAETAQLLASLHRHDKVLLFGSFGDNPSSQKHITLDRIEVVERWPGGSEFPPFEYPVLLPEDLEGKTEIRGKVHAVAAEGRVLVLEYRDWVVPVFVEDPSYTRDLCRGDKILIKFEVMAWPKRPVHLRLKVEEPQALQVFDPMVADHGKKQVLQGSLVLFPKSPQIIFDIFAIQVIGEHGLKRNYTLVNFENFDRFTEIREKLGKIWKVKLGSEKNGRNMWINPEIQIRASGIINVVSPNQANPQILLESASDILWVNKP